MQSPAKRHNKNQQSWDDVAVGWIDKVLGAPSPGLGCGAARSKQSVRGALVRAHAEGSGTYWRMPVPQTTVERYAVRACCVVLLLHLLHMLRVHLAMCL